MLLAILGILDGGEEAVIKNGRYSDGYYSNSSSIDTTYNSPNGTPEIAQDNSLYYVYASGLATVANNNTPTETSGVWYTYATGARSLANGAYTNGYYDAGTKSDTYDNATPGDTIDGDWYTYVDGVATAANGAYSNGYYDAGTKSTTYSTPTDELIAAIDGGAYHFSAGVPTAATQWLGHFNCSEQDPQNFAHQFRVFTTSGSLGNGVLVYYNTNSDAGSYTNNITGLALVNTVVSSFVYYGDLYGIGQSDSRIAGITECGY